MIYERTQVVPAARGTKALPGRKDLLAAILTFWQPGCEKYISSPRGPGGNVGKHISIISLHYE